MSCDEAPYPNVTPQMWKDGERYAKVLAHEYANRMPVWMDRDGFLSAAMLAVVRAAPSYDASRGAWTTLLNIAITRLLVREMHAQINAARGYPPGSQQSTRGDECPLSLDRRRGGGEDRLYLRDLIVDERETPAEHAERACAPSFDELVSDLPPHYARILRLHYVDGLTYREIGEQTNQCRQAPVNHALRALRRLRVQYAHREAELLGY